MSSKDGAREVRPLWEAPAEAHSFDDLARGLASGTISRSRAIKMAGAALLGAALLPFLPAEAEAAKKRCKPKCKTGFKCKRGRCRSACPGGTCSGGSPAFSNCQGDPNCVCFKTATGGGFCFDATAPGDCTQAGACATQSDCPSGTTCVVDTCCPNGGVCVPNTSKCGAGGSSQAAAASGASGPTLMGR